MQIYQSDTDNSIRRFVNDLALVAKAQGFLIHNKENMTIARLFRHHGTAEVAEGFDLLMIQICKPEKTAQSLDRYPERTVLVPKCITNFICNGKTVGPLSALSTGNRLTTRR